MNFATNVCLLSWLAVVCCTRCPATKLAPLPFVIEYSLWRGWTQALIYAPGREPECHWATVRLIKCLNVNGVAAALDVTSTSRLRSRLGVVVLSPTIRHNDTQSLHNLVKKLYDFDININSYDWLILAQSYHDYININKVLNATSMRFDQNIVVGFPFTMAYKTTKQSLGLCDHNFVYKTSIDGKNVNDHRSRRRNYEKRYYYNNCRYGSRNNFCYKTEYERNYYRTTERFRNLTRNQTYKKFGSILPLLQSGIIYYNFSKPFVMTNISRLSLRSRFNDRRRANKVSDTTEGIHVLQYFKVQKNSTLYAHYLGTWSRELSMSRLEIPYPVEVRNFLGEEITVGRCNSSVDDSHSVEEEGPSASPLLDDVLNFLTIRLNATSKIRYYSQLGFRSYDGAWTGLLGALMDHTVDLAFEPVTAQTSRHQDMDFIFPIAETMCNIYIRQQETSTVRDIFLAPFSARLLACVVAVALVASLTIVLISKLTPSLRLERHIGYTEAVIWSTGILCQQGGTWTPSSSAASILLIVCLFFAVVTYNAYAAFITSVLSVRVASVDTVAAVLHSPNFKIGYIRNSADQMYLMSTKDAQLNAFYIRGYSDAENLVSTAEEGLARAASQDYAFFAGQRAARSTLRSLSQARGRCAVRELPVYSTRAQLAFPLPRRSPYARPTLVSLLLFRSSGALNRLEAVLVPAMPHCAPPPGFASARAADVRSALILLLAGLIAAPVLGIGEYAWKNRVELRRFIAGFYQRCVHIII